MLSTALIFIGPLPPLQRVMAGGSRVLDFVQISLSLTLLSCGMSFCLVPNVSQMMTACRADLRQYKGLGTTLISLWVCMLNVGATLGPVVWGPLVGVIQYEWTCFWAGVLIGACAPLMLLTRRPAKRAGTQRSLQV
jgi:MFS family permease